MSDDLIFIGLFLFVLGVVFFVVMPAGLVLGCWKRAPELLSDQRRASGAAIGVVGTALGAWVAADQTAAVATSATVALAIASVLVVWLAARAPRPQSWALPRVTVLSAIWLAMLIRIIRMFDGVHTPGPDPRMVLLCEAWLAYLAISAFACNVLERRRRSGPALGVPL